mmetsp:Transcript_20459/g.38302  ORF Transcript_20459/g.38302 Transcript_20459/m.38302 type:complete len:101 (-) Transcript_20459:42-344(-)
MSRYERNSAMAGFNQHRQESLLQVYSAKFFDSLHSVIATSKTEFSYDRELSASVCRRSHSESPHQISSLPTASGPFQDQSLPYRKGKFARETPSGQRALR